MQYFVTSRLITVLSFILTLLLQIGFAKSTNPDSKVLCSRGIIIALKDPDIRTAVYNFLSKPENLDMLSTQELDTVTSMAFHDLESKKHTCETLALLALISNRNDKITPRLISSLNGNSSKIKFECLVDALGEEKLGSKLSDMFLNAYRDTLISPMIAYEYTRHLFTKKEIDESLLESFMVSLDSAYHQDSFLDYSGFEEGLTKYTFKNELIVNRLVSIYERDNHNLSAITLIGNLGVSTKKIESLLWRLYLSPPRITFTARDADLQLAAAVAMFKLGISDAPVKTMCRSKTNKRIELDTDAEWYFTYYFESRRQLSGRRFLNTDELRKLEKLAPTSQRARELLLREYPLKYESSLKYRIAKILFENHLWEADSMLKISKKVLRKPDFFLREYEFYALSVVKDHDPKNYHEILYDYLDHHSASTFRKFNLNALDYLDQRMSQERILHIANKIRDNSDLKLFSYLASGGDFTTSMALSLREYGIVNYFKTAKHEEAQKVLSSLPDILKVVDTLKYIKSNFQEAVADFIEIKKDSWREDDWAIIESIPPLMKNSNAKAQIDQLIFARSLTLNTRTVIYTLGVHFLFWICLIALYPRSKPVQSIFFWNKYVRKIFGFFYVDVLLTNIPYLRGIILNPFKANFLRDANLGSFNAESYFKKFNLKESATGDKFDITGLSSKIKGQIIIEGESGLGKTMLLKYLIKESKKIAVFLPAEKCNDGIIAAIKRNVFGFAETDQFLMKLVYIGAIDIYIDGLNEVSADTRAKVCDFCDRYLNCNIIISTQPMQWNRPAASRVFEILPLETDKILEFLVSQQNILPTGAINLNERFINRCKLFVDEELPKMRADALKEDSVKDKADSILRILSNPMDNTLIASILAMDEKPNFFKLQEQQYQLMAKSFGFANQHAFPLKDFSEAIYKMRLNDTREIPYEQFESEVQCMEKFKMVYKRISKKEGNNVTLWYFRHDKIMEFFILQSFFGQGNLLVNEHLSDPRFSGVYFLLAFFLPIEAAEELERRLLYIAVDRRDHSVSDQFIQILRGRRAA